MVVHHPKRGIQIQLMDWLISGMLPSMRLIIPDDFCWEDMKVIFLLHDY
jgi:hypothetical protein